MEQIIKRVIAEGIVEIDGYRYVCDDYFPTNGTMHVIRRISLESLDRQYEEEFKTADEIAGWEEVATVKDWENNQAHENDRSERSR